MTFEITNLGRNVIQRRILWWAFIAYLVPGATMATDISSSVIGITTQTDSGNFRSSGVFVQQDIVVSGCSGAYPAKSIQTVFKGGETQEGTVVYHDNLRNICLIKVKSLTQQPAVKVRGFAAQSVGASVVVAGVGPENSFKSTSGKLVPGVNRGEDLIPYTDAPVFNGAAGGGVFDVNGRLIGIIDIVGGKLGNPFAITPASWIKQAIQDFAAGKVVGNDEDVLANAALRDLTGDGNGENICSLDASEKLTFIQWENQRSATLHNVRMSNRLLDSLTNEVVFCEARRGRVDPDLLLALFQNLGTGNDKFIPSGAANYHGNMADLSPVPVGIMLISGWRLNRAADSSSDSLRQMQTLLETPLGNLRAGLSVLRADLDATDNNVALAIRSYVLQMDFVPETLALQLAQKSVDSLASIKSGRK